MQSLTTASKNTSVYLHTLCATQQGKNMRIPSYFVVGALHPGDEAIDEEPQVLAFYGVGGLRQVSE